MQEGNDDSVAKPTATPAAEYDPELDIKSKQFNPLKVLMSPKIDVPVANAPVYDNCAMYEAAALRAENKLKNTAKTTADRGKETSSMGRGNTDRWFKDELSTARRFAPHQGLKLG